MWAEILQRGDGARISRCQENSTSVIHLIQALQVPRPRFCVLFARRIVTYIHGHVNHAFPVESRQSVQEFIHVLYFSTSVMPGSIVSSFSNSSSMNLLCKACPLSLSTFGPFLQVVSARSDIKLGTYSAILQSIKNAPWASMERSGLTASTTAAPPVTVGRARMRIMMRSTTACSHGLSSLKRLLWHMPGVKASNMTFDSGVTGLRLAISRMA